MFYLFAYVNFMPNGYGPVSRPYPRHSTVLLSQG